jgi:hypothetical protein
MYPQKNSHNAHSTGMPLVGGYAAMIAMFDSAPNWEG